MSHDLPSVSSLFDNPARPIPPGEPWRPAWQWGSRGDPHLWAAMQEHVAEASWPAAVEQLDELLAAAFLAITGRDIGEPAPFFVARFSHGGLTSGYVSPQWWRERGLPFVRERYLAACRGREGPDA